MISPQVHETKEAGVYVAGLREDIVSSAEQVGRSTARAAMLSPLSWKQLLARPLGYWQAFAAALVSWPFCWSSCFFPRPCRLACHASGAGAAGERRAAPPLWRDQDEQELVSLAHHLPHGGGVAQPRLQPGRRPGACLPQLWAWPGGRAAGTPNGLLQHRKWSALHLHHRASLSRSLRLCQAAVAAGAGACFGRTLAPSVCPP